MGRGDEVKPGEVILAAKMNLKQETWVAHINLLPEGAVKGLPADAPAGTIVYEGKTRVYLDPQMLGRDDKVYIEVAKTSSAGDETVTIEIYDDTAGAVVASLDVTGSTPRIRSGEITANLTAGNEIHFRAVVTTPSATSGATFDLLAVRLVVVGG